MLLNASDSTLLIVDMQSRLMPVIHDGDSVLARAGTLARAARLLDVPVVATEHHGKMLGPTVEPLSASVQATFQKMHFSSVREPGFEAWLPARAQDRAGGGVRGAHLVCCRPCWGWWGWGWRAGAGGGRRGLRRGS
ncbi:isochorismatase family protein, partial [Achromobacter sp. DMS1]|uniref:isochorismatase family protein n=1 Tax=Achromobacter sp. DMS1 TaxID=1688405 RepID=UPI001910C3B0